MEQAKIKDKILNKFKSRRWLNHIQIESTVPIDGSNKQERQSLALGYLNEIYNDRYIDIDDSGISSLGSPYKITSKGTLFIKNKGYETELLKKQAENKEPEPSKKKFHETTLGLVILAFLTAVVFAVCGAYTIDYMKLNGMWPEKPTSITNSFTFSSF